MSKIKVTDFIDVLERICALPTKYNNKYPYNLGYFDGKYYSYDCWNLIKIVLSGYDVPVFTIGYYFPVNKLVTGDIDGATLLAKCSDKSKDFKRLLRSGTYLYISNSPHSGIYIGDKVVNGHTVNVIECTGSWENKVQYTYVDENGGRYQWKGGSKNKYSWTDYGLLTEWVEYEDVIVPTPAPQPVTPTVTYVDYTVKKGDTLSGISKKYNVTVDEILACNPQITNKNMIYVNQVIKIPVKTQQTSTSATENETVYHIVQKGETLSGIAKKYKTTYVKLAALNKIANPNKIYVGQKLKIR